MTDETPVITGPYKDDDLVYVDPDTKSVVGPVEWSRNGNPKQMPVPAREEAPAEKGKGERRRGSGRKFYPWGTYRSMKRVYRLEGKPAKNEPSGSLDEVIEKALKDPFWE